MLGVVFARTINSTHSIVFFVIGAIAKGWMALRFSLGWRLCNVGSKVGRNTGEVASVCCVVGWEHWHLVWTL